MQKNKILIFSIMMVTSIAYSSSKEDMEKKILQLQQQKLELEIEALKRNKREIEERERKEMEAKPYGWAAWQFKQKHGREPNCFEVIAWANGKR